ncbi:lipoprotein-releasing ABC transporter permease subunit [Cypionkella sp.]|uniref:lipoprotein-releasing ABC transporter permease subunit n=1 Tax=Cypionkella sp. TaxID=2811411 RepID=UPI00351D801F
MLASTSPFSRFEFMIAWRYLRAKRAEGGVSVMTWISLIGITLAVFALIVTLAVRSGFRTELVSTFLGSNAHVTVYSAGHMDAEGQIVKGFADYDAIAAKLVAVPGVTEAAPQIKGQVMLTAGEGSSGAEVFGLRLADLRQIPRIGDGADAYGNLDDYDQGIAIGSGLARTLGVTVGDKLRVISPSGVKSPFGSSPRVNAYPVVYIFTSGNYLIDQSRMYMPFAEAQSFFNRDNLADEFEVMVQDPEAIDSYRDAVMAAGGQDAMLWTWMDSAGSYLNALKIEDNVMFLIMSILVLISTLNIISGLIMLVKNKGRDIGILRTMGLTEGSILRIFFICGAFTGVVGTLMGVVIGCLFATYIDDVVALINLVTGGDVWDPSIRGIYALPAELKLGDVASAMALSLGLSFIVTIFPARRAARMNPVEALRYE